MDCQKQVICFWPSNLSKDVNTHFHTLTIFYKTITKKDRKVLLWNQKLIWCDNVSSIQLSLKNQAKWYNNFVDRFHWTQVFHGPSILVGLSQINSLHWGTTFGESTRVCFSEPSYLVQKPRNVLNSIFQCKSSKLHKQPKEQCLALRYTYSVVTGTLRNMWAKTSITFSLSTKT